MIAGMRPTMTWALSGLLREGLWVRLRGGRAAPTRPGQAVGATGLGAAAL
jgi:hypothetical protein